METTKDMNVGSEVNKDKARTKLKKIFEKYKGITEIVGETLDLTLLRIPDDINKMMSSLGFSRMDNSDYLSASNSNMELTFLPFNPSLVITIHYRLEKIKYTDNEVDAKISLSDLIMLDFGGE